MLVQTGWYGAQRWSGTSPTLRFEMFPHCSSWLPCLAGIGGLAQSLIGVKPFRRHLLPHSPLRPAGSHTIGSKGYGDPYTFDNEYYRALLRRPWLDPKVRNGEDLIIESRDGACVLSAGTAAPGCLAAKAVPGLLIPRGTGQHNDCSLGSLRA